jgi:hypothetical protein
VTRATAPEERISVPSGASAGAYGLRPAAPRPTGHRLRRALRHAAPALYGYAAVRAVGLVLLMAVKGVGRTVVQLGTGYDAGWYVRIVRTGYAVSNGLLGKDGIPFSPRAFFPLFPALAEPIHRLLPVSAGTALLMVSWPASLLAAWGIFACAAHVLGRRAGVFAAVLWGVLPLAAVENMSYSEGLFTAVCAWALYAVLTRRWIWAGVLSVAAGLTRPTAMALTAAVGLAALVELCRWWRERGDPLRDPGAGWWRPLVGGLLSPLGWAGYILWTGWVEGSWGAYFHIQEAWGSSFDGGAHTLLWFSELLGPHHGGSGHTTANLVMGATTLAYLALFAVTVVRRQPLVLLAFSTALLVMDLGNASPYPPLARFLLPAFPLLFPLAQRLAEIRNRSVLLALLGTAAVLSGAYGVVVVFLAGAPA